MKTKKAVRPTLQIKHLTINHRQDLRCLINNLSFVLREHDRAAIIGEEGNGKSTLLQLICNPSLIESYCEFSGEILRPENIGYLEQELPMEKSGLTAYEYFCSIPGFYDRTPGELRLAAQRLGLAHDIYYSSQTLGTFSGGENVKLRLLALAVQQPDILLLDEPSNDLDIPTLQWLERFIKESDVPVLYISHDETLLENTANVIIHLEQVHRKTIPVCTVTRCGYREYIQHREASRAHQTQVARKEKQEYEKQQEKFRRIQSRVEHEQNAISRQDPHGGRLLKKKMAAVKSMERRFEREHNEMTQLPETEDEIFVRFSPYISSSRGKTILDMHLDTLSNGGEILTRDIHLHINGGEKVCIVGQNGVGKTTLLRLIAGQLLERKDLKAAYMPQNYTEAMDMSLTPVEFLSRTGDKDELTAIRTYLGSMRYTAAETEHAISSLSGGQKAKLFFIAMNLDRCDVLILDEPTRNFSPLSGPVIRNALKEYGGTIISVSHDRKYISEVCDRVLQLESWKETEGKSR